MARCKHPDCTVKNARFGTIGSKIGKYCSKHKERDFIDVIKTRCIKCQTSARWNLPGNPPLTCAKHKKANFVDVCCRYCEVDQCNKRAIFRTIGAGATRCNKHKKSNMIKTAAGSCVSDGCFITPTFGLPSDKHPTTCSKHREPGFVNIANKTCTTDACMTRASYGIKKPIKCHKHSSVGMRNFNIKLCKRSGCSLKAQFAGTLCVVHKRKNSLPIWKTATCIVSRCQVQPYYNKPGKTIGRTCFKHKKPGYVRLQTQSQTDDINIDDDICNELDAIAILTQLHKK